MMLEQGKWQWHDLNAVNVPENINMLLVDAPPGTLQPRSRFPAIPLLYEYFAKDITIIWFG